MRASRLAMMVLGFGVLLPLPGHAQEEDICADAGSNAEIGACARKAYDKADGELNAVWNKVMATFKDVDYMPPQEAKAWKEELLASQRAWVQFKEHDCETVGYEWWGGSGASSAITFCLLSHTTARTEVLKERYLDR